MDVEYSIGTSEDGLEVFISFRRMDGQKLTVEQVHSSLIDFCNNFDKNKKNIETGLDPCAEDFDCFN